MAKQKLDQETQIGPSDVYDDTKSSDVALETAAQNILDDLNAARSQLKRFLHGNDAGNWWDDPVTVFGANACLKALLTAAINGGLLFTTDEKTSNYTAVNGDFVLCNSSGGAFTVKAPASPSNNYKFGVKLHAGTNAITVDGNGKDFDGAASTRTLPDENEWRVWQFSTVVDEWLECGG